MSTKFVSIKCPECGAALDIEEGRNQVFCSYCGTKIKIENDNEYVCRNIDEAKVKQVEAEQMLRMREMELEEKEQERTRKSKRVAYIVAGILFVVGLIVFTIEAGFAGMIMMLAGALIAEFNFLGVNNSDKKQKAKRIIYSNEVQITEKMCDCKGKNFNSAVALYQSAGFVNVKAVPMCDLNIFSSKKNAQVDEIAINGNSDFDEGDVFLKTDNVTITYHSLRG
jgi:DNA-directed RNA polymerase subunit RPC12/RpoP